VRLRALAVSGFRNLTQVLLEPGPSLTVLVGDNGQGKTNVLEAIYYLGMLRSFRTSEAADLITHGADRAELGARIEVGGLSRRWDVVLERQGRRRLVLDGKPVKRAAAALGSLAIVLFVPEDLLLPRAAPSVRRRFMDMAIWAGEAAYLEEASAFQRLLKQRNAWLRKGLGDRTWLESLDEGFAKAGGRIVMRRRSLVAALGERVAEGFRRLHADVPVELGYASSPEIAEADGEPQVAEALLRGLVRRRVVDERRRHTTFGPQSDDLVISLGGRPAREHASQGQLRSLVLALKLAELALAEERRGEAPVLLLDDVPSELDAERRARLFETISALGCQTLISLADATVVPAEARRQDVRVLAGQLFPG
jgi:DNA replication and repair protein RecF